MEKAALTMPRIAGKVCQEKFAEMDDQWPKNPSDRSAVDSVMRANVCISEIN
jgi:hypothetical protein